MPKLNYFSQEARLNRSELSSRAAEANGFVDRPDCQETWCVYGLQCPVTCSVVIRARQDQAWRHKVMGASWKRRARR